MALHALLLRHVQCLVESARHLVCVERVDQKRTRAEGLSGADELGEDEHAVVLLLARDVLEGDLAHALAQGGDEQGVGEEIEGAPG